MISKNLHVSSIFVLLCLFSDAKQIRVPAVIELDLPDEGNLQGLDLPPPNEVAKVARYVVNNVDWGVLATHSVRSDIQSFPYGSLLSYSDGPVGSGTGIPYMYTTPLDFASKDLKEDRRATLAISLAQTDYCKSKQFDAMDPRCARVALTGRIIKLANDTEEYTFAKNTYNNRHPYMQHVPADHRFYFVKMDIVSVALFDNFGGAKIISGKEYLHPEATPAILNYYKYWKQYSDKRINDRRNDDGLINYFSSNY